jgi:hypothetical protein
MTGTSHSMKREWLTFNSTMKVSLAYSTPNNVLGCDIYGDLEDSLLSVGALKRTQVQNRLLLREVMTSFIF